MILRADIDLAGLLSFAGGIGVGVQRGDRMQVCPGDLNLTPRLKFQDRVHGNQQPDATPNAKTPSKDFNHWKIYLMTDSFAQPRQPHPATMSSGFPQKNAGNAQ